MNAMNGQRVEIGPKVAFTADDLERAAYREMSKATDELTAVLEEVSTPIYVTTAVVIVAAIFGFYFLMGLALGAGGVLASRAVRAGCKAAMAASHHDAIATLHEKLQGR